MYIHCEHRHIRTKADKIGDGHVGMLISACHNPKLIQAVNRTLRDVDLRGDFIIIESELVCFDCAYRKKDEFIDEGEMEI